MYSCRASKLPQNSLRIIKPSTFSSSHQPSRAMSLFPRFITSDFAPLISLVDEVSAPRYRRHGQCGPRSFRPSFDVRELKETYELKGELPGLDQSNISIEFTDPQTLVIKGRVERESTHGASLAAVASNETAAVEGEKHDDAASDAGSDSSYQKPTVEDAQEENEKAPLTADEATPATTATVEAEEQQPAAATEAKTPKSRYWVSERSVGQFHRVFTFNTRVNQEAVTASLKNGILSIVVPKAPAPVAKRIEIA